MFTSHFLNPPFDLLIKLFRKSYSPEEIIEKLSERQIDEADFSRIRCPLCKWQPKKSSRWMCTDADFPENFFGGCFTEWNTFETRGLCPGCCYQWRWTVCLSCYRNSLHEDWYINKNEQN